MSQLESAPAEVFVYTSVMNGRMKRVAARAGLRPFRFSATCVVPINRSRAVDSSFSFTLGDRIVG